MDSPWIDDAMWERCRAEPKSPVVSRQYATDRGTGGEALAEAAIHEDGTISLRVVLYEN